MSKDPKRKHYSTVDGKAQKRGRKKSDNKDFIPVITHEQPRFLRRRKKKKEPKKTTLLLPEYQEELGKLREEIAEVDKQIAKDEAEGKETSVDLLIKRQNLKSQMVDLRNRTEQEIRDNLLNDVELREQVTTVAVKNELLLEKQKELKIKKDAEREATKKIKKGQATSLADVTRQIQQQTKQGRARHYTTKTPEGDVIVIGVNSKLAGTNVQVGGSLKTEAKTMYGVQIKGERQKIKNRYAMVNQNTISDNRSLQNALKNVLTQMGFGDATNDIGNAMWKNDTIRGQVRRFFRDTDEQWSIMQLNTRDGKVTLEVQKRQSTFV